GRLGRARHAARRHRPRHPARDRQDARGNAGTARVHHREGHRLLDVRRMIARAIGWALIAVLVAAGPAVAAEVRVLSAGAMKAMVTELSHGFQKETGHTVVITADTGGGLRKRVEGGEKADVLVAPDAVMDALAKSNHTVADSRRDLARTAVGVAVREGAPQPHIFTVDAFKRAVLEAKSIVYLDPATGATSGIHV